MPISKMINAKEIKHCFVNIENVYGYCCYINLYLAIL